VDDRYHLCLTLDGQPAMQGWWAEEEAARKRFTSWIGERGRPGVRITLVDELEQRELASWPDDPAQLRD
jgi:hypothetical protein